MPSRHCQLARWSSTRLLDDLVRPLEQRLRDRQAQRLGRLEVDHELPFCRLLDREIGGLDALQDLVREGGRSAEQIQEVRRIGHKTSGLSILSLREHCGQPVLQREICHRVRGVNNIELDSTMRAPARASFMAENARSNSPGSRTPRD